MPHRSKKTLIFGVCPHDCPDACAFITEAADGRAINLTASSDHPITQGWLCAKVRPYSVSAIQSAVIKAPITNLSTTDH